MAIKLGVIMKLYAILTQITSFTNPIIVPCALAMLKSIAMDYSGASIMASNNEIITLVFHLMRSQKDLTEICSEIVLVMSLNVVGEF